VYLDDQRTHEVHALVEPRVGEFLFSTTELPAGSRDATEALIEERVLGTTDQLRAAMLGLETRLALQGTYYRADAADMQWRLVPAPQGARALDLRAHEVAIPGAPVGAKMGLHHFHAATGNGRDALLVSLPRLDLAGQARSILAELEFDYPNVDEGDLRVLHTRLAAPTLKSRLVQEHVELPKHGYAKLVEPRDYQRAFGASWLERTRETFRLAASRVLGIRQPEAPAPLPVEEYATVPVAALAQALESDRVQQLATRYLTAAERRALVQGGELNIRRYFQARQRRADHHAAFDLAMLQTALLVQYGLDSQTQSILDEEGAKLLRYATRV
jgi:hypothetical protein